TNKKRLSSQALLSHLSSKFVEENIQFFIDWLIELEQLVILSKFLSNNFSFSQILSNAKTFMYLQIEIEWNIVLSKFSEEMLSEVAIEINDNARVLPSHDSLYNYLSANCHLYFILENP